MVHDSGIPFLDLAAPHREMEDELVAVFRGALRTAGFVGGPMVEGFERDFSEYCNAGCCVGVGSGTDALRFALLAGGVERGDIVITVANTFIATAEAISQCGAAPAFVDIDERTYNMDAGRLLDYILTECRRDGKTGRPRELSSGRTASAIVPVHLYGQMADMDPIMEIAEKYNLAVIEDACQAHGAEYFSRRQNSWRRAGSMGQAAAFSFYPGKNLGACGEGGAVTTSQREVAGKVRMLRDHGQTAKYFHEMEGYNGRLDALQAGILRVKLRRLSEWNESRRRSAERYNELLTGVRGIVVPHPAKWSRAVYHLYVIRTRAREELQAHLLKDHISTGLHYPLPLHLQKAYKHLGYNDGDLPVTERVSREILSLPMYPGLGEAQLNRVAGSIREFFGGLS